MLSFCHGFKEDLTRFAQAFDQGYPFALSRFADGEWQLCIGSPIVNKKAHEHWWAGGGSEQTRRGLLAALRYASPSYYLGLSPQCCVPQAAAYLRGKARAQADHLTFATLFCHDNYDAFLALDLRSRSVLVSSAGGDFAVPNNAINEPWDLDGLVASLRGAKKPILVAAGPAACVIIHRYWTTQPPEHRQIIVDVGAAYDPEIHGENTRVYHAPQNSWRRHVCRW